MFLKKKRKQDNKGGKSLKEDSRGMMYIKDIVELEVSSTQEAFNIILNAEEKRINNLNSDIGRGHTICTIRVVQAPFDSLSNDFSSKVKF